MQCSQNTTLVLAFIVTLMAMFHSVLSASCYGCQIPQEQPACMVDKNEHAAVVCPANHICGADLCNLETCVTECYRECSCSEGYSCVREDRFRMYSMPRPKTVAGLRIFASFVIKRRCMLTQGSSQGDQP